MSCDVLTGADGAPNGHACSRGPRGKRCACGNPATKLCDFVLAGSRGRAQTCDVDLCDGCAVRQPGQALDGETIDYCGPHARYAAKPTEQLKLTQEPER